MIVHRSDRPVSPAVLWLAGLCWAGFIADAWLMETHRLVAFDAAGLTVWREPGRLGVPLGPPWLAEAVRDMTALGGVLLRNAIALLAVAILLGLGRRSSARRIGVIVIGGWLLDVTLKAAIGRTRPLIVPHLMVAGGSSFPSGHSFNAVAVYGGLAIVLAEFAPGRALRRGLVASGFAVSALVALSRVWLGVHYPSDALGGWLAGAGWTLLASSWQLRRR